VGNVRFDLSPDEDTIAVLLEKPVLLSIGHRHEPRPLTASRGLVFSTAFSPDGKRLLLGTNDGIRVWDVPNGVDSKWFDFGFGAATALSFSPDGLTCAAGGENGQIVVWDVDA
jgi:WD40 repeat protein